MQKVSIPWGKWYEETQKTLEFPDAWDVHVLRMAHQDALDTEAIVAKIDAPIGSPTIEELAQGKQSACIVVDDISRPTPLYEILPSVIKKLEAAGIAQKNITVLIALGGHRPLTRPDMLKKVGAWTLEHVQVINHSPFAADFVQVGENIEINRVFMEADLRISVGCLVPHGLAGFSGGAKNVVPGVCSINTLKRNHTLVFDDVESKQVKSQTCNPDNPMRQDMERIVGQAGLHFIINAVLNDEMRIADLFCGDMVKAHRAACDAAKKAYRTDLELGADILVVNAYPKDTDYSQVNAGVATLGQRMGESVREDGSIVMITAASEGAGYHALFGPHMVLFNPHDEFPVHGLHGRDACVYTTGVKQPDIRQFFKNAEPPEVYDTWGAVLAHLEERYEGKTPKVVVVPMGAVEIGYIDGEIS